MSRLAPPRRRCRRCGTCCRQGGPVLHHEDRILIGSGPIGYQHLITIRRGETVVQPLSGETGPADQELIKLRGRGPDWACCLLGPDKATCTIYAHRPLECRLLKCWQPAELEAIVGRDTLARRDLIPPRHPIIGLIAAHDRECDCTRMQELLAALADPAARAAARAELVQLVNRDLAFRARATRELGLDLALELFVLGRPLFKLLQGAGIEVREVQGELRLS